MSKPVIADNQPRRVILERGSKHFFCACGRSATQPYCDGSHKGTDFRPLVFTAEKPGEAWLCACKHSGKIPYCDGSHKQFPNGQVGKEGPGRVGG